MPIVAHQQLRQICRAVAEAAGTPADIALAVSESLVEANLAGHDSHGMLRLPWYVNSIQNGLIQPDARAALLERRGATAVVDGKLGWGQPAARLATQTAIELAADAGIGAVTIVNCNHIGRVGEYVTTIAHAGMVGIAVCNAGPAVAPYGGYERIMGTNPLAWAAPRAAGQAPLVLDFATSYVAEGKLRVARSKGELVPLGVITDSTGTPTTNPADFYEGGSLNTFGLHKGSGLSLMIELMARGLTGIDPTVPGHHGHNGTLIIALNTPFFANPEQFFGAADRLSAQVSASKPAQGFDQVLLPGEPELRMREQRAAAGIPIPEPIWDELNAVMQALGVQVAEA